ncbi:response regulator [Candidatus Burkholderia verschuerenii]|uniref:response regulator n=1 Tax=Candidatus Burkholderia verschuerenii TaxID=242163 RepID=UPI000B197B2C|nr:response regulator [Candidatus Burkholderia verschuerenii]
MPNVLVVEDDAQTLEEIVEALTDHGCTVQTAQTGRDGLLLALANEFDVIVLDRMLPGGLEGLGMLASMCQASVRTPVLILSALSAVDERVRGLRAGGDDYLTKPLRFGRHQLLLDFGARQTARLRENLTCGTERQRRENDIDELLHRVHI